MDTLQLKYLSRVVFENRKGAGVNSWSLIDISSMYCHNQVMQK